MQLISKYCPATRCLGRPLAKQQRTISGRSQTVFVCDRYPGWPGHGFTVVEKGTPYKFYDGLPGPDNEGVG